MLAIPAKGMGQSINAHNVRIDVLCDWIEASALFLDEAALPDTEVVEALVEGEIYASQSFAWEIVADAWSQVRRRQEWIGQASPIDVQAHRLVRQREWRQAPAHSFCLALTLAHLYPVWARQFGKDFTEQGELFEKLTQMSLEVLFPGWKVHATGWTRTHTKKLHAVVEEIANLLNESKGEIGRWTKPQANEAGLDLLCYRPFPDGRVGVPLYLMQCASGRDWEDKLHTPRLEIWTKIIQFAARPAKAFATPFAIAEGDFPRVSASVTGLTLDRYRLLSCGRDNPDWLSDELAQRIIAWLAPRVSSLPKCAD